jgi:hypothetical protein
VSDLLNTTALFIGWVVMGLGAIAVIGFIAYQIGNYYWHLVTGWRAAVKIAQELRELREFKRNHEPHD